MSIFEKFLEIERK